MAVPPSFSLLIFSSWMGYLWIAERVVSSWGRLNWPQLLPWESWKWVHWCWLKKTRLWVSSTAQPFPGHLTLASPPQHPEQSYFFQVAKFHPLQGGRRQSSLAYHALSAATMALHPPSSPHCCPVTFAPLHTSLTALQNLLTGCGPAGLLAFPDVAERRTVVQNEDIKSLKTVSSETVCGFCIMLYLIFYIILQESEALFLKAIKAHPNAASYHGNLGKEIFSIWILLKFRRSWKKWVHFCKIDVGRMFFSSLACIGLYNLVLRCGVFFKELTH